jgi:D-aspartate ligase
MRRGGAEASTVGASHTCDASRAPPAVLLGGGNIALSAARNLAAAGVAVYALGHATDLVRWSRCRSAFIDVGAGKGVQERYLEWLERRVAPGAVVLPCDDESLELVALRRARLVALDYRPIEANDDVLLAMLDKERTYAIARKAGIPAPRTVRIGSDADVERALAQISLPCALKPIHSHKFAQHFGAHRKLIRIREPADLERGLTAMRALEIEMLATEIIPGRDDEHVSYYSYLDERGQPLFHFTKQKVRQFPVAFGLACYQVTRWRPDAAQLGLKFFQAAGLRGVGNVEFKRDQRDGRLTLMECNHRFTAADMQVKAAGIDIPLLTYRRAAGQRAPRFDHFREGIWLWHFVEDLRALGAYRREGEWTTVGWARSLLHRQRFPVWRADDPLPSAVAAARHVRDAVRRVARGPRASRWHGGDPWR